MKKSILILGFITIIFVYLYNIKVVKEIKEIIILKSKCIIKKETNLLNLYEYTTEETTKETQIIIYETKTEKFEDSYKKIGSLFPENTDTIISKLGYNVSTKTFKDIKEKEGNLIRNVVITYPYITGFKSKKLQNKVNKEIEDSALKAYYSYREYFNNIEDEEEKSFAENIYWETGYTIEYIDKNVISIVFRRCQYTKGAAVAQNIINSANINLKTGNKIKINDLLKDSFKNVLRLDKLNLCEYNTIYEKITKDSHLEQNLEELVECYFDSINKSYDKFYIKENKFIFIFLLIDTDWAFAVDYSDLIDSIKWENEVWSGILKKERG